MNRCRSSYQIILLKTLGMYAYEGLALQYTVPADYQLGFTIDQIDIVA